MLHEQRRRDEQDATRAASPLVQAPDAVALDTTRLSIDEVIEQVLTLAARAEVPR